MAKKPSTHRRAHGENGCAVRRGAGRLNNAALVTKPKLLHFGLDYLRLCVGTGQNPNGKSLRLLSAIFSQSHNDTNAATYRDFVWGDTLEEVDLLFGKSPHGEVCYVSSDGWTIMGIEKLSEESSFYKNIRGKYQYVVSFYGAFFALFKLGLDPLAFWRIFDEDIERDAIVHCVSRADICADIKNISVLEIEKGIAVQSPTHAKPFTRLNVDWETGIPETFYYGKTDDKRWHGRAYNKIKDINHKHTEALFPNYWVLERVTRLEIELHEVCREFRMNFLNCRDVAFQLSIVKAMLKTKYVHWKILPFLLKEMKEKGFNFFALHRVQVDYDEMPKMLFYKRTLRKNLACVERMRVPLDVYFSRLRRDMEEELSAASSDK